MGYYDNLINSRKGFLNQLANLIDNQFKEQENLTGTYKENLEKLEDNPDYIQRVFIDAPWGMGKTYFGKSLKEYLESKVDKVEIINVWETDYFSDPMKSLIGELKEKEIINQNIFSIAQKLVELNWKDFLKKGIKGGLEFIKTNSLIIDTCTGFPITPLIKFLTNAGKVAEGVKISEEDEYKEYKDVVDDFKEKLNEDNRKRVIIIDELDRCKPDYAISMLEIIKHFFGVKNIIFVFLVNKEQLKNTVLSLFLKEDKNEEYFEKFFDIQFQLPEIDYGEYIEQEYKKYYDVNSYEVDETNYSDKIDLLFEKNFLDVLKIFSKNKINDSWKRTISLRSFIKIFKKFKVLIKSLSDEERGSYSLILCLIIYFYCKEFNIKYKYPNGKELLGRNLYLKGYEETFKKINENLFTILSSHSEAKKVVLVDRKSNISKVAIPINNSNIYFKNLYFDISWNGNNYYELHVSKKIISEYNGNNYDMIWDWCEEKYNFINRIN